MRWPTRWPFCGCGAPFGCCNTSAGSITVSKGDLGQDRVEAAAALLLALGEPLREALLVRAARLAELPLGLALELKAKGRTSEAIKRLVESGFGYSMLPEFALRGQPRFFHVCRIAKRKLVRQQALAMVHSDHPRALTDSIAKFLLEALGDKLR